jgi:hypothetical protein
MDTTTLCIHIKGNRMNVIKSQSRWASAVIGALIVASLTGAPASARQDPGTQSTTANQSRDDDSSCPLARVGTQLVRCDNLTGDGVPAPLWVPEL